MTFVQLLWLFLSADAIAICIWSAVRKYRLRRDLMAMYDAFAKNARSRHPDETAYVDSAERLRRLLDILPKLDMIFTLWLRRQPEVARAPMPPEAEIVYQQMISRTAQSLLFEHLFGYLYLCLAVTKGAFARGRPALGARSKVSKTSKINDFRERLTMRVAV